MKPSFAALLMSGCLALGACATPQQLELIEREQKRLRSESLGAHSELENLRSSLADTRANIQELRRDLNALKGRMDEVQYLTERQIGKSTQEGDHRVRGLEARLAKLEESLKAQGDLDKGQEEELRRLREGLQRVAPGGVGESAGDKTTPAEAEAARKEYEEAIRLVERKEFRPAVARFKDFLKKYPASEYADNAQYWIGECHYALKEYDQAILEFDAVRRRYPNGDKVPAALLKQGFAFAELGDRVDARLILQELIDRYPKSEEAAKAKQKLRALGS